MYKIAGACLLICGIIGCAPGRVQIRATQAKPVYTDGVLTAVQFKSVISASGMQDEQIVYQVRLMGARGRPIRSTDGRYQNRDGEVAAARTMMVLAPDWTFDEAQVAIPITEMEIQTRDVPVSAEFAVLSPTGTRLASQADRIPLVLRAPKEGMLPQLVWSDRPVEPEPQPEPRRRDTSRGRQVAAAERPAERPPEADRPEPRPRTTRAPAARPSRAAERNVARSSDEQGQPGGTRIAPPQAPPARRPTSSLRPRSGIRPEPETPRPDERPDETGREPRRSATERQDRRDEPVAPGENQTEAAPSAPGEPKSSDEAESASRRRSAAQPTPRRRLEPERPTSRPGPRSSPDAQKKVPTTEYVVRAGDTLTTIAARQLLDAARWIEIFDLNRDQLESPEDLREGMTLRVPTRPSSSRPANP